MKCLHKSFVLFFFAIAIISSMNIDLEAVDLLKRQDNMNDPESNSNKKIESGEESKKLIETKLVPSDDVNTTPTVKFEGISELEIKVEDEVSLDVGDIEMISTQTPQPENPEALERRVCGLNVWGCIACWFVIIVPAAFIIVMILKILHIINI